MEEQGEEAVGLVERPEHRRAQRRRRQRRLLAAPRGEVGEVVVGVEQLPAEREHRHVARGDARRRRAVGEAELAQQRRRRRGQLAARRPEAARRQPERAHPLDAARERGALGLRVQPRPVLVAPAVAGHLVPARVEVHQRLRVELGVEPLDEERRPQARLVERLQQPRQRLRDRVVRAQRLVLRPPAALEVARLAEVVEGDGDRRGHSAATGVSSRPTRSISTTIRSPSRSSTFGSRR